MHASELKRESAKSQLGCIGEGAVSLHILALQLTSFCIPVIPASTCSNAD